MGCAASAPVSVRVVIIGGGVAGTALAKALDAHVDVTLVERRDRYFHHIGMPRALTTDDWETKLFIPYKRLLSRGRVVTGVCTGISTSTRMVQVQRADDAPVSIPYDFLILATGSNFAPPVGPASDNSAAAKRALTNLRERVRAAKNIVVVGGGPVGVEMAGEIATDVPGKSVTLVHSGPHLLSGSTVPAAPPAVPERLRASLEALGVRVVLSTRGAVPTVLPAGANWVLPGVVAGAHAVSAPNFNMVSDLTIHAIGGQANTQFVRDSLSAASLDEFGRVRVRPTFQLEAFDDIFALGDIANTRDGKMAYIAGKVHAPVVVKNILRLARAHAAGQSAPALEEYHPGAKGAMFVTTGRNTGVGYLGTSVAGNFLVSRLKGRELFVSATNAGLGYKQAGVYPDAAESEGMRGQVSTASEE